MKHTSLPFWALVLYITTFGCLAVELAYGGVYSAFVINLSSEWKKNVINDDHVSWANQNAYVNRVIQLSKFNVGPITKITHDNFRDYVVDLEKQRNHFFTLNSLTLGSVQNWKVTRYF